MSGNVIYDVFMGASLNPRLFTSRAFALGRKRWDGVDLKMFAEVRVPWVLLFMIAVSGAVKQYQDLGYVTPVSTCARTTSYDETGDLTCACLRIEHALHDPRDRAVHQRLVSRGIVR